MPQKDFDELKAEFANDVQSRMDDPRIQARDVITEHFNHYPKDDPRYRLTSKELKAAIEKSSLDDVKSYYDNQFESDAEKFLLSGISMLRLSVANLKYC